MQAIRSILVVIEGDAEELALKRAKLIAGVTQSHLHLLVCDDAEDRSGQLRQLCNALLQDGYSVSGQQAWHGSVHDTIGSAQQAEGCGLVIKRHRPDNPLKKALLTPDDWKLLRYCPCPVLLVKTHTAWAGGNVLAAVDVGNADGEHRELHTRIVDHGYDIANLAKASLHVISAHPSPMLAAADPTFQLQETIEAHYRQQCRTFQQTYDIDDEHLHIAQGPADVLIPHFAHQLQAAVTVIGSVARTGFSGALIGNTAEVILDTLESDILVLKPDGIIEHLEQRLSER
ncbi:Nucleotide-binding universal stress protein, UspA family [Pseudomonas flavescens]|uniref:Nucleotide-binding universal stress protein, UspA family n=1 Tax=Phytopseudomonas flavescens TaxID=29435 RepID=A0A1G8K8W9_9GAMM|nr:universal stress protein [Pseudomonas flavescens]SDI39270.1 Nucleotide-binding universal stress protein, UspA family [Pseudomonas flavescens]